MRQRTIRRTAKKGVPMTPDDPTTIYDVLFCIGICLIAAVCMRMEMKRQRKEGEKG